MWATIKGHVGRVIGKLKLALGRLMKSEKLLASGAAQTYRAEQKVAEATAKARKWADRRKS